MNSNLNTKWNECLKIFRDNVSKNTFDTWFADIKPLKYENNTLTIQVKSNFVCEFIEGNFLDLLRSKLYDLNLAEQKVANFTFNNLLLIILPSYIKIK